MTDILTELRQPSDAPVWQNPFRAHELAQRAADQIERLTRERDEARKRAEKMHRRAQKAEGKLSRTGRFVKAIVSWIDYEKSEGRHYEWWLRVWLVAALDHARAGSGKAWRLQWTLAGRKANLSARKERDKALAQVAALRETLWKITHGPLDGATGVSVDALLADTAAAAAAYTAKVQMRAMRALGRAMENEK